MWLACKEGQIILRKNSLEVLGCSSVVAHLPSMYKVLTQSLPFTAPPHKEHLCEDHSTPVSTF